MTLDEAIQHAREVASGDRCECANVHCADCWRRHEQLAKWLEELRDRRSAPGHELISRAAAVSALMRLRVFDPIYELNRRYPGYSVLPRDCIERTLAPVRLTTEGAGANDET